MQMQQALEKKNWEILLMKDPNSAAFIEKETVQEIDHIKK